MNKSARGEVWSILRCPIVWILRCIIYTFTFVQVYNINTDNNNVPSLPRHIILLALFFVENKFVYSRVPNKRPGTRIYFPKNASLYGPYLALYVY